MATTTNTSVQAIEFSNSKIRPTADLIYSAYLQCKSLVNLWNSQQVSTVLPNDTNQLGDGAAADGRPIITDAQATTIITRATELVNWLEQGLVASPFTGTANLATLNTIAGVQVNGQSKF